MMQPVVFFPAPANPPDDRPGHRACQASRRVLIATAAEWVARLSRYPLLDVGEAGCVPARPRRSACSSGRSETTAAATAGRPVD